jgi:antitoxin component YwqK of YwqJK toxin-antitoxin module
MKNEFIPYEQALALKELGFDEQCFSFYNVTHPSYHHGELYKSEGYYRYSDNVYKDEVIAPLYQQAFRWFREKYGLYHRIEVLKEDNGDIVFDFVIIEDSDDTEEYYNEGYLTYKEAELACLKKLIELSTQSKSENAELTPYIEYHDNGNVRVKGQKNSKRQEEGIWEWFWENGNISMRIPYKGGKKDGIEEWFYPNGNIQWRIPYKEGKRDGIEEWFYGNGNIRRRNPFKNGMEDGIEEWFYPNGNTRLKTTYKEGKEDGIVEWFDEQGNITLTRHWKDGKLIEKTKH